MTIALYPAAAGSPAPSFMGNALILPAISIGSVPQLAVDLLIHSPRLALTKVARLDAEDCVPFAGPNDELLQKKGINSGYGGGISTPLEVFQNSQGLAIIQQRSPVLKSRKTAFVQKFVAWIREAGFKEVLVLTSMDAGLRADFEMDTPLLHVLPPGTRLTPQGPSTLAHRLSQAYPAHKAAPRPSFAPRGSEKSSESSVAPHIPGGGLTRRILIEAATETEGVAAPDLGALLMFCSEGDNRGDAHALARAVSLLLGLDIETELAEPRSWTGLFGSRIDQSLFG